MTIFALMIAVQNPDTKKVSIIHKDYELSSITLLARNDVKNAFKFLVRESLPCIQKHTRNSVKHEQKLVHILMSGKPVAAYAFVDDVYPQRVIFALLKKALDIFFEKTGDQWKNYKEDQNLNIDAITEQFKRFQDPKNADKLTKAIHQVDQTKIVLHQSIKKLLERQGDLDDLVNKSDQLSKGAKQFYKSSKEMDKGCCVLI